MPKHNPEVDAWFQREEARDLDVPSRARRSTTGLLARDGEMWRAAEFTSVEDLAAKPPALEAMIAAWIPPAAVCRLIAGEWTILSEERA
jgi:hypothetical protein